MGIRPKRRWVFLLICVFLRALGLTPVSRAQDDRWKELRERAAGLQADGNYTAAVSAVKEALDVAEATYGDEDVHVAVSLDALAFLYGKQLRYTEAEPLYKRALAIEEKVLGPDHPDVAAILNNLAALYYRQGRYTEAEPLYKGALAIDEKALGPEHAEVASSLDNLGELYYRQGKYADAEPLFKRALAIEEKALGPDSTDIAITLNNLGELYYRQGKYADAEPLFKRALAIDETLGPDHPDVARSLNNLAALYESRGKYAEAEPLFKRALAIDEKALGPNHTDVAARLHNLAALYESQGKYVEAEPLYKRALAIEERALGPDRTEVAESLNNLAGLYREQGKYADAEPLYERALAIDEKALGPVHPTVSTDLNNLAGLYESRGKYAKVEPLIKRALAIDEEALGPNRSEVASDLNNLAIFYEHQGKYADAEPLIKRALAIDEKALGPNHSEVAMSLNNLAGLYHHQGKYADAEPLYKRALAIREKTLGPDHPDVAQILSNLAALYQSEGKYADAEALYKRALTVRENRLPLDHPRLAPTLNSLAVLYEYQGRYAEAEPLLKRALSIDERTLGPDHPEVAKTLADIASLYDMEGRFAEAEPLFEGALQHLSKQFRYSFTYMSEKDRLQFLNTVQNIFSGYFSFSLSHAKQDHSLAGRMYDLSLWEKGMVGASVAALRAQIAASEDAEAIKLLDDLAAKRNESSRLATLRPASWEHTKKGLDDQANSLEAELARRVSLVSEQQSLADATWREVQKKLRPGEAAVELVHFNFYTGVHFTGKSYYACLVVTPRMASEPLIVSLGESANLEGAPLQDYQRFIDARGAGYSQDASAIPGEAFYRAFWKPLESALEGAKTVYISPDGVLDQVALGILPGEDGEPLLSKYDLRIVSSTRDLLRSVRVYTTNTAVLAGNPSYNLTNEQYQTVLASLNAPSQISSLATATISKYSVASVSGLRSHESATGPLPPLPGTAIEIGTIAGFLEKQKQKWQVLVYEGDRALVEAVREVRHPRVLYLATHGFFESDQAIRHKDSSTSGEPFPLEDPMTRSGLYFAGADRAREGKPIPEGLGDGILTAYEASTLDLHGTEMVVLSACETGLGRVEAGEGVFGLLRGFEEAGADSVVISMWKVPDDETQELMSLFYEKWLSGKEKHDALREAQREMRERVKMRWEGEDRPYYWGAFVLVGP